MTIITQVKTYDSRFPTSTTLSGSDAMNLDPDYSSAYVEISTSADDGTKGIGFVFTIGRGNDVVCKAIESMSQVLIGRNLEELLDHMRLAWDLFVHDSQLRWLGPEKGVEHMAIGAVLSALWDIKAKRAGNPIPAATGEQMQSRILYKAVPAGQRVRHRADRRHPRGRSAGDRARIPYGAQVQQAGLPACGRRRPVRGGMPLRDVRLRCRVRHDGRSND